MDAGLANVIASESFGPYSNYSVHQGYDIRDSSDFRETVEALVPTRNIAACADWVSHIVQHALHVRRGDFRTKESELMHASTIQNQHGVGRFSPESYFQNYTDVLSAVNLNTTRVLFIATNDQRFVYDLRVRYPEILFMSGEDVSCTRRMSPNQVSLLEQTICVRSKFFTGNRFSSWSSEVINRRLLQNMTTTLFGLEYS
jgi:GDP-fucose protein O-fucosyltransferase.